MGKAILVAVIVVCAAALIVALIVAGQRLLAGPGVRRRELADERARLRLARTTLQDVRQATEMWKDVDSVLAAEVKELLRGYDQNLEELNR